MANKRLKNYFAAKNNEALMKVMPALEAFADSMGWPADGLGQDRAACLKSLRAAEKELAGDRNAVVLPNPDKESFFENPFMVVELREEGASPPTDMSCAQFLAAAAMPGWNDRLFRMSMLDATEAPSNMPGYVGHNPAQADECRKKPLGFGCVEFPGGPGEPGERVNFLYDKPAGRTLMVGQEIGEKMAHALAGAGVKYSVEVDRFTDQQALKQSKNDLAEMFNGISRVRADALNEAVSLRISGGLPLDVALHETRKPRATAMARYRPK